MIHTENFINRNNFVNIGCHYHYKAIHQKVTNKNILGVLNNFIHLSEERELWKAITFFNLEEISYIKTSMCCDRHDVKYTHCSTQASSGGNIPVIPDAHVSWVLSQSGTYHESKVSIGTLGKPCVKLKISNGCLCGSVIEHFSAVLVLRTAKCTITMSLLQIKRF